MTRLNNFAAFIEKLNSLRNQYYQLHKAKEEAETSEDVIYILEQQDRLKEEIVKYILYPDIKTSVAFNEINHTKGINHEHEA